MKRMLVELWVTDEKAAQGFNALTGDSDLADMVDETILGVRLTLPDGNVLRAGETFG